MPDLTPEEFGFDSTLYPDDVQFWAEEYGILWEQKHEDSELEFLFCIHQEDIHHDRIDMLLASCGAVIVFIFMR